MTKKITTLFTAVASVLTLFFISTAPAVFSPERNGGIAEMDCSGCHTGGSSGGSFLITGIPETYTPGQNYSAQLCLTDPGSTVFAGGFSMYQGDFASDALAPGDATSYLIAGNSYLTHNGKKFFTNDEACWDFTWNAPNVGSGLKMIRAAGNAVNNDGSNGSADHGDFMVFISSAEGPLPIDLVNFSVSKNDINAVLLNWETSTEINNDYFLIERSYNAREFEEIGKIAGAGNTSDIENYSYVDERPELNRPIYYRLKQVDFDGAFEYSLIKKILIEQSAINIEKIYPNPVFRSETVKVKFNLLTDLKKVEMIVYDMAGHEKMKNSFFVTKGENIIDFSPNNFIAGQYFIVLTSDNQRITSNTFIVTE